MVLDTGGPVSNLTQREFFAAMAVSGLLAKSGMVDIDGAGQAVKYGFLIADLMIEKSHQDWKKGTQKDKESL